MVYKEKISNKHLSQKFFLRIFLKICDIELFMLKGRINGHEEIILVDNRYTYNFVSKYFSKRDEVKT